MNGSTSLAVGAINDVLLYDACDLARLLGVAVVTIRRRDSAGMLPRPVRWGGAVRWRAGEINRWVEAGCPDRKAWDSSEGGQSREY